MNDESWVKERLQSLDSGIDWRPDAQAAYRALQGKRRQQRRWQNRWLWSLATAAAFALSIIALPAPAKCALVGVGCVRPRRKRSCCRPQ